MQRLAHWLKFCLATVVGLTLSTLADADGPYEQWIAQQREHPIATGTWRVEVPGEPDPLEFQFTISGQRSMRFQHPDFLIVQSQGTAFVVNHRDRTFRQFDDLPFLVDPLIAFYPEATAMPLLAFRNSTRSVISSEVESNGNGARFRLMVDGVPGNRWIEIHPETHRPVRYHLSMNEREWATARFTGLELHAMLQVPTEHFRWSPNRNYRRLT